MIDSHCHLADEAFAADLGAVVQRAREAGLIRALCIVSAGDRRESERAERLVSLWPEVRFALGVHPHHAIQFADRTEAVVTAVRAAVQAERRARALGEVGLDYHYDFSPRGLQRQVFGTQVRLASELGLPLVVHTREAEADTIEILRDEGRGDVTGVLHCFSGTAELARQGLDLGFCVSFAGIVTFPRADDLRAVARLVPDERLLVETDCPYLAPAPFRGRRNEPAWVVRVVEALAEIRGTTRQALTEAVTENFERLFRP